MRWLAALSIALIAGAMFAAQAPINAQLARHTNAFAAAAFSAATTSLVLAAVTLISGQGGAFAGITRTPTPYLLGGLLGVVVIAGSIVAVRVLGSGGQIAAMVTMQITAAVAIDRFGLLGVPVAELDLRRLLGVALLVLGTGFVVWR